MAKAANIGATLTRADLSTGPTKFKIGPTKAPSRINIIISGMSVFLKKESPRKPIITIILTRIKTCAISIALY